MSIEELRNLAPGDLIKYINGSEFTLMVGHKDNPGEDDCTVWVSFSDGDGARQFPLDSNRVLEYCHVYYAEDEQANPDTLKGKYWKDGNMVMFRRDYDRWKNSGKDRGEIGAQNSDYLMLIVGGNAYSLKCGCITGASIADDLTSPTGFERNKGVWDVVEVWEPRKNSNCGSLEGVANMATLLWTREPYRIDDDCQEI